MIGHGRPRLYSGRVLRASSDHRSVRLHRDATFGAAIRARSRRALAGWGFAFLLAFLLAAVGLSLGDEEPGSLAPYMFCLPAIAMFLMVLGILVSHAFRGLTKLTVTFSPDGIVEELHDQTHPHPWSWLSRFRDEDRRLVLELGVGGAKHVLVVEKLNGNGRLVAKKLLVMFADHGSKDAGVFTGGRPVEKATEREQTAKTKSTSPNLRDLN